MNNTFHGPHQGESPTGRRRAHASASGTVRTPTARVNTGDAHGAHDKPHPRRKRSSAAVPVVVAANTEGRSRSTVSVEPASHRRTLAIAVKSVRRNRRQGAGGISAGHQQQPSSPCVNVSTKEHEHDDNSVGENSVDAPLALGGLGSVDEVETSGRLSDRSVDEDPSVEDIFDCYDGDSGSQSDPGWESSSSRSSSSSSSSDILLHSEENDADGLPRPAESPHDDDIQQGEGDDERVAHVVVEAEELERGDNIPVPNESTLKKHDSKTMKTSRRKRREMNKKKTKKSQEVNTGLGDAWSSRWLTGE